MHVEGDIPWVLPSSLYIILNWTFRRRLVGRDVCHPSYTIHELLITGYLTYVHPTTVLDSRVPTPLVCEPIPLGFTWHTGLLRA